MYKNSDKDFLGAAITAGLGAGIVTSFAVNQGQDIGTALGITALAALCGVICRHFDLMWCNLPHTSNSAEKSRFFSY